MPCTIDLPEKNASWGLEKGASELEKAVGNLGLVVIYYLPRIGKYTVKQYKDITKQTEQFKMPDVTFFKYCKRGRLRRFGRNTKDKHIMMDDGVTLKIGNQKNGWKNVSIFHEENSKEFMCPGKAIVRRYCGI